MACRNGQKEEWNYSKHQLWIEVTIFHYFHSDEKTYFSEDFLMGVGLYFKYRIEKYKYIKKAMSHTSCRWNFYTNLLFILDLASIQHLNASSWLKFYVCYYHSTYLDICSKSLGMLKIRYETLDVLSILKETSAKSRSWVGIRCICVQFGMQ